MIHIDRGRIARPKRLDSVAAPILEELRDFYEREEAFKRQRQAKFPDVHIDIVKGPLWRLFYGKCAYCEIQFENQEEMQIDRFRPKTGAMNLDGSVSKDHYWWLAYEWENLFPICRQCKRYKGRRFPVQRKRAEPELPVAQLEIERPLLLNPCLADDEPEEALLFDTEGMVHANSKRGDIVIDVFNLNRSELVKDRAESASRIAERLAALSDLSAIPSAARSQKEQIQAKQLFRELREMLEDSQPFAALHRQLIRPVLDDPVIVEQVDRIDKAGGIVEHESSLDIGGVILPKKAWPRRQAGAVWIDRVEIENFKAIQELELNFALESDATTEPWIILLGENGVGKSSVLKAIALVFMDPKDRKRVIPDAGSCVYNEARPARGAIRVHFNSDQTVELKFAAGSSEFSLDGELPSYSILGYGATRLPPPPELMGATEPRRVRVGSLFDPREALGNAEHWLTDTSRVDAETFGLLAGSIRQLLDIEEEHQISRFGGSIRIGTKGKPVPLKDHSDGYQSMVALATDIMLNLASDWKSMESAEGTVLLDEIEAHLHPKWKIEIVSRLRGVFPRIRFIATTHDPLCLQGSQVGEVYRLYRDFSTRKIRAQQMEMPTGLRADQLLTGAWFGLSSTIDQDTLDKLNRHGELVLKPRLSKEGKTELAQLKEVLRNRLGGYGETALERLAIGVTAQIMIEEREKIPQMDPQEIRRWVLEDVRAQRSEQA